MKETNLNPSQSGKDGELSPACVNAKRSGHHPVLISPEFARLSRRKRLENQKFVSRACDNTIFVSCQQNTSQCYDEIRKPFLNIAPAIG